MFIRIVMKIWKIVFWLLALVTARDFLNILFSGTATVQGLLNLAASLLLLIPYYGYAYQLVIGWKKLWQSVFLLVAPFLAYQWCLAAWFRINYLLEYFDWISALFFVSGLGITLVIVIPPYQYAFRSNTLWLKNA